MYLKIEKKFFGCVLILSYLPADSILSGYLPGKNSCLSNLRLNNNNKYV